MVGRGSSDDSMSPLSSAWHCCFWESSRTRGIRGLVMELSISLDSIDGLAEEEMDCRRGADSVGRRETTQRTLRRRGWKEFWYIVV